MFAYSTNCKVTHRNVFNYVDTNHAYMAERTFLSKDPGYGGHISLSHRFTEATMRTQTCLSHIQPCSHKQYIVKDDYASVREKCRYAFESV